MYRLYTVDDESIGATEKLNYIRLHDNGCFVLCDEKRAQGIAFNGQVYSIGGVYGLQDKPIVRIETVDTAVEVDKNYSLTGITFVTMAEAGSIDDITAVEHADLFAEWAYPIVYKKGNIRRFNGILYRCIQDHTSQVDWTPDVAVSMWVVTADPAEEWPAWSQPIGAHDAYDAGAKVSHNDKRWTSDVNGNVWEPGAYGWTEYVEEVAEE